MAPRKHRATQPLLPAQNKKSRLAVLAPAKPALTTATYPWDTLQDSIWIKSIEGVAKGDKRRMGVKHYQHVLSLVGDYEHICIHPKDDHINDFDAQSPAGLDEEEQSIRDSPSDPSIDYNTLPCMPLARSDYKEVVYVAKTYNPAVFLTIVRIAQKNQPFLDLTSAINHLPNLAPADRLPALPEGTFVGDLPYDKRSGDQEMTVVLLPYFYSDSRHALGYYVLTPDAKKPSRLWMRTALFTPCTTNDLEDWDMIADGDGSEEQGTQMVGARGGRWVDQHVVEDYDDWCLTYKVVGNIWQIRIGQTMGKGEDGARWKGN